MIDITLIVESIIALASIVVTVFLIPLILSKTTASQQALLQALVHTAVYAAEQIFKAAKSGHEKKNYVLTYLEDHGITCDPDKVNALIESEVRKLNIEQGE